MAYHFAGYLKTGDLWIGQLSISCLFLGAFSLHSRPWTPAAPHHMKINVGEGKEGERERKREREREEGGGWRPSVHGGKERSTLRKFISFFCNFLKLKTMKTVSIFALAFPRGV
jgi:hypothetical protein